MQWTDTAIILSARRHGENSAVVRVLTREHGVYAGIVRASHSKTNRGVAQPGNIVAATWQARLSEHLGTLKTELLVPNASLFMQDAQKLAALLSACTVIETSLPERHPYEKLYREMLIFLDALEHEEHWPEAYVKLELALLAESGFGLDLSACAATGTTDDLIYVSPKSGRAVCREAGEPYKEKLLPLPAFLLSPPPVGGRAREGASDPDHRKPDRYGSHTLISNARELRTDMTDAEKRLWYYLRAHRFNGYRFRRQHAITPNYIVDFVCLDKKLIIELDGGQHAVRQSYDEKRTAILENEGYRMLRFWNNDVLQNTEGVLTMILDALKGTPSLTLPPNGGGNMNPLPRSGGESERGSSSKHILAGLTLTGYFLDVWLLEPHRRKLPAARRRLVETLQNHGILVDEY